MDITHITSLLGGIALFLYGMSIMGAGLEKLAGGKMQGVLQLSLIHISEPTRRTPISYAVFCLKKKKTRGRPSKTPQSDR